MNHSRLAETITHLRGQAAFLYDLCKARNNTPEEIRITLGPLIAMLKKSISEARLAEQVLAIEALENEAKGFVGSIKFFQQKILDTEEHILSIKNAIKTRMESRSEMTMCEDGFTACLSEDGEVSTR